MELTGEQIISETQENVWQGLNDPEILKICIPGCDKIEKTSENEYAVSMTAAVGPVKAKFKGTLQLSNLNPPASYDIAFNGSGGVAGFGKGTARVTLEDLEKNTRLIYSAKATVGGKLAQVGARLIDGVASKMADDFFAKFNATISKKNSSEIENNQLRANSLGKMNKILWIPGVLFILAVISYVMWLTNL